MSSSSAGEDVDLGALVGRVRADRFGGVLVEGLRVGTGAVADCGLIRSCWALDVETEKTPTP
ncbi:hypothetical protein QFZ82_007457 [Streptomyces sp. V4I23]|uniref:hypothetical protein n=1 Tax=Streptomyces sp. V4I23 TaxID=3042282 RepID=UPI0027845222|nr:hypothetical protein [Streptomyces sp. V4I23]MDQ1012972.1 hypothetical protein [Streptomyces sp. V4I23]